MRMYLAAALLFAGIPLAAQSTAPLTADQLLTAKIPDLSRNKVTPAEIVALYLADLATDTPVAHPGVETTSQYIAAASATRRDVHVGAPAGAPASTAIVQRPGFADLLSLAVENGVISASETGNGLTITATPYALAGFLGHRDHEENWSRFAWLRQLSLSATVVDRELSLHGDLQDIVAGAMTLKLTGSASPRDVAPAKGSCSTVVPAVVGPAYPALLAKFTAWTKQHPGAGVDAVRGQLATLFGMSVSSVRAGELAACAATIAPGDASRPSRVQRLHSMLAAYLAQKQYQSLSITASAQRDPDFSDYSTLTLVYSFDPPSKLVFNFNGALNHNFGHRAPGIPASIDRLRSYSLVLSATMTGLAGNRFDGTLTASHTRNNQVGAETVTLVQLSGALKLSGGSSLPMGFTYAPEPVENFQRGWQFHVGLGTLLDHILTQ